MPRLTDLILITKTREDIKRKLDKLKAKLKEKEDGKKEGKQKHGGVARKRADL